MGSFVSIRSLEGKDFEKLSEFFAKLPEDRLALFKEDVRKPEVVKSWCESGEPQRIFAFIACEAGMIKGFAALHTRSFGWARFVGKIRLATERERVDVAEKLLIKLMEVGRSLTLHKLWFETLDIQNDYFKLAKKLDFKKAGILKKIAKDPQGNLHDVFIWIHDLG